MWKVHSLETISFHCSRVSGPPRAGWSKQCSVLLRDIIISILPIIWQMLIEIMLFQLGRHSSSDPKLMNKGRKGRMEGATDSGAVGQHFTCVVMIWCWRDDSHGGRGVLQAQAWRAGAVIFKCLHPVTSEQCLVRKRHLIVISSVNKWTNK